MHELLGARQVVDGLLVFAGIERGTAVVGRVTSGGSLQVSLRKGTLCSDEDTDPGHPTGNSSHAVSPGMVAGASLLPSKTPSMHDYARSARVFEIWSDAGSSRRKTKANSTNRVHSSASEKSMASPPRFSNK